LDFISGDNLRSHNRETAFEKKNKYLQLIIFCNLSIATYKYAFTHFRVNRRSIISITRTEF
jgi:hypothetical protein